MNDPDEILTEGANILYLPNGLNTADFAQYRDISNVSLILSCDNRHLF